ncbi:phosphatase PAP2 family protein [Citricoccus sp. NR2]|uniref:phosphatase PAP2 family protein n=1 Tax=Citricoccus sp. NR2 TaxID=3004095 RepID=UPI0022DE8F72|nr:phosphatase PAP2 family protein [Citricoccus sp. NR2]WBL20496.1 phosphatase PAP2 family protein [Citricoccus sp. NR2]
MTEHRPSEPISARRPLPVQPPRNAGAPEPDDVEIQSATDLRVPIHPTRGLRTAPAYVPEARRLPGARVWAWLIAVIVLGVGLGFVHRIFVTSNTGQIWEYAALQSATESLPDLHAATSQLLQHLPQVVGIIAILAFIVLTVYRRRWLASLIAAATFGAANLTTQVLKNIVLDRPMLENGVPYYTGNSLPSGHTTFAAAAVVAVFLVVAPRWRPAVAFIGALFATAVGVGTFVEAWHRPSDMVAAYLVAGIWGLVGGFVTFRTGANWNMLSSRTHRYPWPSGHPMWDVLMWLTGAAMLAGAWLALLPVGGAEALPATVDSGFGTSAWYLLSGALFSAGGGFLLFALLSSFFRWEAGRKN